MSARRKPAPRKGARLFLAKSSPEYRYQAGEPLRVIGMRHGRVLLMLRSGYTITAPRSQLRTTPPKATRNPSYPKCAVCRRTMAPADAAQSRICGSCARQEHRRVMGNPSVKVPGYGVVPLHGAVTAQWSRMNQAWIVMWHDQVLRVIGSPHELIDYLRELGMQVPAFKGKRGNPKRSKWAQDAYAERMAEMKGWKAGDPVEIVAGEFAGRRGVIARTPTPTNTILSVKVEGLQAHYMLYPREVVHAGRFGNPAGARVSLNVRDPRTGKPVAGLWQVARTGNGRAIVRNSRGQLLNVPISCMRQARNPWPVELHSVVYKEKKPGDARPHLYEHEFGETGGPRPKLAWDGRKLNIQGGRAVVRQGWIHG